MIPFLSDIKMKAPDVRRIGNPQRRQSCANDFLKFCNDYFGAHCERPLFVNPQTFQNEFCADIQRLVLAQSTKKMARAAPRGFGKTSIAAFATIWAILYGHRRCIVWFCVNGAKAKERLDIVQNELIKNRFLIEDFPEICCPLIEGKWSDTWTDDGYQFANGSWILGHGIDGANLGTNKLGMRPDWIVIDDPEDTSTIKKTGQNEQSKTAQNRFNRIDKEIAFLGEPGKPTSFLMITTIRSRGCLSDEFTDPKTKPMWEGRVYKAMTLPKEGDENHEIHQRHWRNFLQICSGKEGPQIQESSFSEIHSACRAIGIGEEGFRELVPSYQRAIRYFTTHRSAMEAGVSALDPVRCPIWNFYWQVGGDPRGKEIVWSELQNEPLEDENTKLMRFTEQDIQSKIGTIQEFARPEFARHTFCAVQMGLNEIHWEAKAFSADIQQRHLVSCGVVKPDDSKPRDVALKEALSAIDLLLVSIDEKSQVVVDSGGETGEKSEWRKIVMEFCCEHRPRWLCLRKAQTWTDIQAQTAWGNNWLFSAENNPYGVVVWNPTHYKNRIAACYKPKSNALTLFSPCEENQEKLYTYISHQCSEQYTLTFTAGKEATKATVEAWTPMPKYRTLTAWWNTAAMIEMLADYSSGAVEVAPPPMNRQINRENSRGRRF